MKRTGAGLIAAAVAVTVGCSIQSQGSPESESSSSPSATTATSSAVKARAIRNGPRNVNAVAITLDADYSPSAQAHVAAGTYPKQVNQDAIDVLTETKTPATVFATGMWATTYQKELAKLAANPNFELANHTWNHDAWTKTCYGLPYIGSDQAKHESLQQTNRAITQATGKAVAYVRMPGLCQNHSDVKLMASEGLQLVNTDVPTTDAFATNPSAVAKSMLKQVKPGSILLMHLNGAPNAPVTAAILKVLIPGLKAKGLTPVTLSTLLKK